MKLKFSTKTQKRVGRRLSISIRLLSLQIANVHFGGVGVYMSLKDYLTILRHLLQIKGNHRRETPKVVAEHLASGQGEGSDPQRRLSRGSLRAYA